MPPLCGGLPQRPWCRCCCTCCCCHCAEQPPKVLPLLVQLWRAITVLPLLLLLNALQPLHPSTVLRQTSTVLRHHYRHSAAAPAAVTVQQPAAAETAGGQRWHSQGQSLQTLPQPTGSWQTMPSCAELQRPPCCHHHAAACHNYHSAAAAVQSLLCPTATVTVLPLLLPALCSSLLGTLQSQHDAAAAASLLQQRLQAAECGTARPKAVELGTMLLKLCCRHCYHHDAAVTVQQPAAAMTADGQRWHSQARSLQTLQQQLDSL